MCLRGNGIIEAISKHAELRGQIGNHVGIGTRELVVVEMNCVQAFATSAGQGQANAPDALQGLPLRNFRSQRPFVRMLACCSARR